MSISLPRGGGGGYYSQVGLKRIAVPIRAVRDVHAILWGRGGRFLVRLGETSGLCAGRLPAKSCMTGLSKPKEVGALVAGEWSIRVCAGVQQLRVQWCK